MFVEWVHIVRFHVFILQDYFKQNPVIIFSQAGIIQVYPILMMTLIA